MAVAKIFQWHLLTSFIFLIYVVNRVSGINCYVCSSKDKSDPSCDDPFHPALSTYSESCQVPKENHIGQFPANYCVKIIGTSAISGESLMIRTCVLENMDSQCGVFKFGKDQLTGCILTCEFDGCNMSSRHCLALILIPLLAGAHLIWR
ncbi:U-scoloptoxin(05)-Sm1a-like [Macrobrachium nipponense]|uniref:U-scoloptoxin(05)-Sm1a-like n=1 Tax=Macrobrachium nipponense TaxID=159736 RepID=UPI0030C8241A